MVKRSILTAVLLGTWGLGGCGAPAPDPGRTYKPPFEDAEAKARVYQYDPAAGTAVADKTEGTLICGARLPRHSGQRQSAKAEFMLDETVYLAEARTFSFSAMVSTEWSLTLLDEHDVAFVSAEVMLENMADPDEVYRLVMVKRLLNREGTASDKASMETFNKTHTLPGGRRYRLTVVARAEAVTNDGRTPLHHDRWQDFTEREEDLVGESEVDPLTDAVLAADDVEAELRCTLLFFKLRPAD